MGVGAIVIIFLVLYTIYELAESGKDSLKKESDAAAQKRQDYIESQKLENDRIALENIRVKNLKLEKDSYIANAPKSYLSDNQVLVGAIFFLALIVVMVFYFKMLYSN